MTLETKVQIDVLKRMEQKKNEYVRYADTEDGFVCMTVDGKYAILIPESCFWLDKGKLLQQKTLVNYFKIALEDTKELTLKDAKIDGKGYLRSYVLGCDEFNTHIGNTVFSAVHKNGCKQYAAGKNKPIYFALDEKIYAVCMPIIS